MVQKMCTGVSKCKNGYLLKLLQELGEWGMKENG
jgi:hypothetical protein